MQLNTSCYPSAWTENNVKDIIVAVAQSRSVCGLALFIRALRTSQSHREARITACIPEPDWKTGKTGDRASLHGTKIAQARALGFRPGSASSIEAATCGSMHQHPKANPRSSNILKRRVRANTHDCLSGVDRCEFLRYRSHSTTTLPRSESGEM